MKTRSYTVVMLYPDYRYHFNKPDVFTSQVRAPDPAGAVSLARVLMGAFDGKTYTVEDYQPLAVFTGHHTNLI